MLDLRSFCCLSRLIVSLALLQLVSAQLPALEMSALYDLYNNTRGYSWRWKNETSFGQKWTFSSPLSDTEPPCVGSTALWQGLNCSVSDDGVTHISALFLINYNLEGTIPFSLCDLTAVEFITFGVNSLYGVLPPCMSRLKHLTLFDVKTNYLTGTIPEEIFELTRLRVLTLLSNRFSGTLSQAVGGLTQLFFLNLANNLLSGELPSALGRLNSLHYLPIGLNRWYGSIPTEIGNLTSLIHFGCAQCGFTGQVPSVLQFLQNLQSLTLSTNALTGSFPVFLLLLPNLLNLQLQSNYFTGTVPSLRNTPTLRVLQLQTNLFSGNLRDVFSTPSDLSTVDLSDNLFTGSLPASVFQLPNLNNLALSSNCFEGTLPPTICDAQQLTVVSLDGLSSNTERCHSYEWSLLAVLSGSRVHGSVPECLWRLPRLTALYLTGNRFSGNIGELRSNSALHTLTLSYNHFSGSVPLSVLKQSYFLFDISFNTLSGEINRLGNVSTSSSLDEYNNQSLFSPEVVTIMRTKINRFSGHLASDFSKMKLTELSILQGNMFSCQDIPSTDVNYETYSCGSKDLNISMYVVAASICLWFFVLICAVCSRYVDNSCRDLLLNQFLCHFSYLDNIADFDASSPNIVKFYWILQKYVTWIVAFSCLGIIGFIPVYVLKINYGFSMYEDSYSWIFSLVYTSGAAASILVLVTWVLLVAGSAGFLFYVRHTYDIFRQPNAYETEMNQAVSICNASSDSHSISTSLSSINRSSRSSARLRIPIVNVDAELEWRYYAALVLTFNALVVLGANGLYVFFILSDLEVGLLQLIQVLFACFTLCWNHGVMSHFTLHPADTMSHRVVLRSCIHIFSSVIAPAFVVLTTDPSCFRNLWIRPDKITSRYTYDQCTIFLPDLSCAVYVPITIELDPIYPPFIYNHQCSSRLLYAYVPVFLYSYAFLIFVTPSIHVFCSLWLKYENIPLFLRKILPGILWPKYWSSSSASFSSSNSEDWPGSENTLRSTLRLTLVEFQAKSHFFRGEVILSQVAHHLAVLLTFGLTSPPLALSIIVYMVVTLVMWKFFLGQFVSSRCQQSKGSLRVTDDRPASCKHLINLINKDFCLQLIEESLEGVESAYDLIGYYLVVCSTLYFSFLCFDMIGDDGASSRAAIVAVPCLALSVPIVLYTSFKSILFFFEKCKK